MFQTKAVVYSLFIFNLLRFFFYFYLYMFHLFQVQDLGLAAAYSRDDGTYRYIKQLMALPFLPAQEISTLRSRGCDCKPPRGRPQGARSVYQWDVDFQHCLPPKDWSVYGQAVRTNNDVEGWHNGLNRRASGRNNIPFYLLIAEKRSWAVCRASKVSVRQNVATHPKEEIQGTPSPSLRVVGTICKQSEDCYPAP